MVFSVLLIPYYFIILIWMFFNEFQRRVKEKLHNNNINEFNQIRPVGSFLTLVVSGIRKVHRYPSYIRFNLLVRGRFNCVSQLSRCTSGPRASVATVIVFHRNKFIKNHRDYNKIPTRPFLNNWFARDAHRPARG